MKCVNETLFDEHFEKLYKHHEHMEGVTPYIVEGWANKGVP
jgi:hypothetical protein